MPTLSAAPVLHFSAPDTGEAWAVPVVYEDEHYTYNDIHSQVRRLAAEHFLPGPRHDIEFLPGQFHRECGGGGVADR